MDGIGWPALLQLISSACLLQPCSTTTLSAPSSCHMRALSLTANYASLPAAQSSICNSLAQHHSAILNPQCAIDSPVAISGHTHLPGKRWHGNSGPVYQSPSCQSTFASCPVRLLNPRPLHRSISLNQINLNIQELEYRLVDSSSFAHLY